MCVFCKSNRRWFCWRDPAEKLELCFCQRCAARVWRKTRTTRRTTCTPSWAWFACRWATCCSSSDSRTKRSNSTTSSSSKSLQPRLDLANFFDTSVASFSSQHVHAKAILCYVRRGATFAFVTYDLCHWYLNGSFHQRSNVSWQSCNPGCRYCWHQVLFQFFQW